MRATTVAWWCPQGHRNSPDHKTCYSCHSTRFERHAQVHASERAVVYYNPATGEHKTPARADMPMPAVYSNQGFERREIMSVLGWEKEAGVVQESTTFNPGNEVPSVDPPKLKVSKELIQDLTRDISNAAASGPWTGQDRFV